MPSPNPGDYESELFGVGVISSNDIWAVGDYLTMQQYHQGLRVTLPLAEHWNGAGWSNIPMPSEGSSYNTIYAVGGTSSSDIWALGTYEVPQFTIVDILAEHWNGSQWTILPAPNTSTLNMLTSVAPVSPNDVWAVGTGRGGEYQESQLVEHWNGSSWSLAALPSFGSGSESRLHSVIALAANNVWAVGTMLPANSNPSSTPWTALIEHWDGASWSVVPNPGNGIELWAAAANGANDIWAVGNGPNSTATVHWNGAHWQVVPSASAPYGPNILDGVAVLAGGQVVAVGYGGTTDSSPAGIAERWTGQGWVMQQLPSLPSEATPGWGHYWRFSGAAASSGSVWAVGYDLPSQAPFSNSYQTLIERY